MRRVECRVCREWFESEGLWLCSARCVGIERERVEKQAELSRKLDEKRKEEFENRLRRASDRRHKKQKKAKAGEARREDKLARLLEREQRDPNKNRRDHIEKLRKRGTRVRHVEQKLAVVTKQVRALKQGREPNGFYETRQWQELRYKVLRQWGRKCMLCGASDCELHVDHIKPRSKYPELALSFDNLQVLCRACNMGKSNLDDTDWRPTLDKAD